MKRLPDAELAVMQVLWAGNTPATRSELEETLRQSHPMATTTLLTLLSRLAEKGYVTITKNRRIPTYSPLVSREDYLAIQGRHFFRHLCGGDLSTFATALSESGLTREELATLRDLLERDAL